MNSINISSINIYMFQQCLLTRYLQSKDMRQKHQINKNNKRLCLSIVLFSIISNVNMQH